MAKGGIKVVNERVKKAKTPAQLARKAMNEAEARHRLIALQRRQEQANAARKLGYVGTDDQVVVQHVAAQKLRRKADVYQAIADAQRKYVEESVDGPSGEILLRWLAGRPATFKRVERFFKTHPKAVRVAQAA